MLSLLPKSLGTRWRAEVPAGDAAVGAAAGQAAKAAAVRRSSLHRRTSAKNLATAVSPRMSPRRKEAAKKLAAMMSPRMSPRPKEERGRILKINSRTLDFRVVQCGADEAALECCTGRLGDPQCGEVALIRCRGKYDAEGGFMREIVQAQRDGCCGAVIISYNAGPDLEHLSTSRLTNFGSENKLSIPVVSIGLNASLPFLRDEAVSIELHYSCCRLGNLPRHQIVAHLKKQRKVRDRAREQLRAKKTPLLARNTQLAQSMEHFGVTADLVDKADKADKASRQNETEVDSAQRHTAAEQGGDMRGCDSSRLMLDGVETPFQIAPFSASGLRIQAMSAFGKEGSDLQGRIAVLRRRGKYDSAFIKDIAEAQWAGAAAAIIVMPADSPLELESAAVKAASLLRIAIPVVLLALNHGYSLCRGNHSVPMLLTLRKVAAAQPAAAAPCKEREFDTPAGATFKPAKKIVNPMLIGPGKLADTRNTGAAAELRKRIGPIFNPMQLVLVSDNTSDLPDDGEATLSSDDGEDALSDTSDDDDGDAL